MTGRWSPLRAELKRSKGLVRRTPLARGGPLPRRGRKAKRDAAAMRAAKPALLARSGGRCEAEFFSPYCTQVGAHAHHVWPSDRDRGVHDPVRLRWVCEPCHRHIHHLPAAAQARGLLKPSWEDQ